MITGPSFIQKDIKNQLIKQFERFNITFLDLGSNLNIYDLNDKISKRDEKLLNYVVSIFKENKVIFIGPQDKLKTLKTIWELEI